MKYVLLSFGFFGVQNVSSFSRVARNTPSPTNKLTSKKKKSHNLSKLIYRTALEHYTDKRITLIQKKLDKRLSERLNFSTPKCEFFKHDL